MIAQIKYSSVVMLGMLFSVPSIAAPLSVGMNSLLQSTLPEKAQQIRFALEDSGIEMACQSLPAKRSLNSLNSGEIAIDVYRTPSAVNAFPDVIQINPPVDVQHLWLVTGQPELCKLNAEERQVFSVAGVRGVRLFESIYGDFKNHIKARDFMAVATMLTTARVDFGVWPKHKIVEMQKRPNMKLYICGDKPYRSFYFYSYIHKNYDWAIPQIEQSYRRIFGQQP